MEEFTLVEIVVIITSLGILMVLVVPLFISCTEKAEKEVYRINCL